MGRAGNRRTPNPPFDAGGSSKGNYRVEWLLGDVPEVRDLSGYGMAKDPHLVRGPVDQLDLVLDGNVRAFDLHAFAHAFFGVNDLRVVVHCELQQVTVIPCAD